MPHADARVMPPGLFLARLERRHPTLGACRTLTRVTRR
jgi:hypothetical protein